MTFNDIIKKTVLENMQNNTLSSATVNVTIGICILFALYIYFIYYLAHKKSFFSKQFGITLGNQATFTGLFGAIADTPIIMLRSLFNFDLFGMNMFIIIMSLITGIIVIYVVKKVVK